MSANGLDLCKQDAIMNEQIKKLVKSTLMNALTKLFKNPTVKTNLGIDDNLSGTVLYKKKFI